MKKILLGIYLAVAAVFCLLLELLYPALGLGFVSLILVMNGWCEQDTEQPETNSEQE